MKTTKVTSCRSCPFFSVIDMERIMYCNHPDLGTEFYAGAIIHWVGNEVPIPDRCPLRKGPAVIPVSQYSTGTQLVTLG